MGTDAQLAQIPTFGQLISSCEMAVTEIVLEPRNRVNEITTQGLMTVRCQRARSSVFMITEFEPIQT
jgi:hypothetical protein